MNLSSPDQRSQKWCKDRLRKMVTIEETRTTAGKVLKIKSCTRTLSVLEPTEKILAVDMETHSVLNSTESVIDGFLDSKNLKFFLRRRKK